MSNNLKITNTQSPIAVIDMIRNQLTKRNNKAFTVDDVLEMLQLSWHTYNYLPDADPSIKQIFLMKLNDKKQEVIVGYETKKVLMEGGLERAYNVTPISFRDTEMDRLRFENMKYIFDVYDMDMVVNGLTLGGFGEYLEKMGVEGFNNSKHIEEYFNSIMDIIKDPDYEYTTTDTLIAVIMGYILGFNTTFLEGFSRVVYLFRGITGEDFSKEHVRTKLLYLVDEGILPITDELITLLITPYGFSPLLLHRVCGPYNINTKAVLGMYQELFIGDEESMWATGEFKKMLKHHDIFLG